MFNVSFGKSEGSFATQSGSDGVADLNPDDIESINMLTGPSAALCMVMRLPMESY